MQLKKSENPKDVVETWTQEYEYCKKVLSSEKLYESIQNKALIKISEKYY